MSKTREKVKLLWDLGYRVDPSGTPINPSGKKLKGYRRPDGYIRMGVLGTCHIPVGVHQLQAYQKYGARLFEEDQEVRHLNGDPSDNAWDNISLGNHSSNMRDIPSSVRSRKAQHAASYRADAISPDTWNKIESDRAKGASYSDLVKTYGVAKSSLSYHFNKK